jgi:acyl carrier protein
MDITVQQITQKIVEILSELTERDTFDKETELFDQGINSLQMTILVDELNKRFDLGVGLEILAVGASIDAIAESLNKKLLTRMSE